MNRRSFIALLGGTGATWPLSALGQAGAPVTIGLLSSSPEMAIQRRIAAFREGLQHSGYPLAQNVTLDIRRYIEGSRIAAELANRPVAAIFTMGNVAARAATARGHHAARQRRGIAARGARAAASDPGGRLSSHRFVGAICGDDYGVSTRLAGDRAYRRAERHN